MPQQPINITVYRWGGAWGPFSVKIPCGECALTTDIIHDTLAHELDHIQVEVETYDWLSHWWKPFIKGGFFAPIIMVNGNVIAQGAALNRGVLTQAVIEAHSKQVAIEGTHIFGKPGCPYCTQAKARLDAAKIPYQYHDIIESPAALYEMIGRVKPIIGPKTPVTVPQIWMDGQYIGGDDQLAETLVQHQQTTPLAAPS